MEENMRRKRGEEMYLADILTTKKQPMIGWGSHWSQRHITFTVTSKQQGTKYFSSSETDCGVHPEEGWKEETSQTALSWPPTSLSGKDGLGRKVDKLDRLDHFNSTAHFESAPRIMTFEPTSATQCVFSVLHLN